MSDRVGLELAADGKVYFTGKTFSYKDMIKATPGTAWNKREKRWEMPIDSVQDALRIMPTIDVSANVKTAFGSLQQRQQAAVAIKSKKDSKLVIKGLKENKGKLRPYQVVGVEFCDTAEQGEGKILACDMGTGKSLTSLAACVKWINENKIDWVLVVCPSPLKYATWEKEIKEWTDLSYVIVDGDKRETVEWDDGVVEKLTGRDLRAVQYQQWQMGVQVTVMNYELFLRDMDILPPINGRWAVILDECHRIKNPKATTTKNLRKALLPSGRKVLGSGTPLENNVQELWSTVDFVKPGLLGNYYKFVERYCEVNHFGSVTSPKPQMMPELMKRIEPVMYRVTKQQALPDLPELTIQEYWVDMTSAQKKLYKDIKEGILENLQTGEFSYLEVIVQITRLQQVLDSPAILRELLGDPNLPKESGKLNDLAEIIEDLDPMKHKFVLFSQYREMTDILYDFLTKPVMSAGGKVLRKAILEPHQVGYVKGGMKPQETGRIQTEFQTGGIQCVLMTTAGNYGLDLSAGSYVICYDQLFNPQKMNQIYSRCHRSGVKNAVTAINLVTRNSYEEKKLDILARKKDLFNAVIDGDDTTFAKLFSKQELIEMI
jgi:SNF2 family DNA or RNA helicase